MNFTGATSITNGTNGAQLSSTINLDLFAGPAGQLQALNADMSRAAWFIHPLLWLFVRRIRDSQGTYQLRPWGVTPERPNHSVRYSGLHFGELAVDADG